MYSGLRETTSFPCRSLDLRPRLPLPDDDWLRYRSRATAASFQGTLSDVSLLIRVPTSASSRVLVAPRRIPIDANPSTGTAIARPTSTAYTSTTPATRRAPPTWPTRRIAVQGVRPPGHFSCPNSTKRREMQDHDVRRWPHAWPHDWPSSEDRCGYAAARPRRCRSELSSSFPCSSSFLYLSCSSGILAVMEATWRRVGRRRP